MAWCVPAEEDSLDQAFWQGVYDAQDTKFDVGGPSAPLVDWLDRERPVAGRAIVPGCGRGHDVIELARRGWDALGVDFAPSAVADSTAAARRAGLSSARFLQADIFGLTAEHDGQYDLLYEQTCYCAIEPRRRDEYAQLATRLVKPGGLMVFLIYPLDARVGGPPFNVGLDEVPLRFAPGFELLEKGPPPRPSIARRAGLEHLAVFRRRT
jgi:SAM-dependent methyltransferase